MRKIIFPIILFVLFTVLLCGTSFAAKTLPVRGDLNEPINGQIVSGNTTVRGWFLDGNGVAKIEVLIDGSVVGRATMGYARPDVLSAFPAYANGYSGFQYVLDTTKLTNGTHRIVIRETSKKNVRTSLPARTITVSNKFLPAMGDLNEPVNGQTISGNTTVRGWFLDGSGVAKIEVLVDGKVMGLAATGLSRPDVFAAFPAYANANSGYEYTLDTTKLTNGIHSIVIRETSNKNIQTSLISRTVTVSNTYLPVIGDLNEPSDGQTISGNTTVRGWFLDGNGVAKIEVLIDGNVLGLATIGYPRPDVLSAFPEYANGNSGYQYTLDTTKLTNGIHRIVIRETSNKNVQSALLARTITVSNAIESVPAGNVIVGYYASWAAYSGYTPANIPASKLTHINYAFANIGTDLKIMMGDPAIDPANFTKLKALKQSYPALKTLISVGGWDWSGRFSDVALTDASRTLFADSVVDFLKQNGFDGLDIDWEYPVGGGLAANKYRPEDKQNFTLLLKKIREKFDAQSAADGKQYLLTIAGGAGSAYAANVELSAIAQYLDFANIMTYDIHGPWDRYTDFNAPLYASKAVSPQFKWGANDSVMLWKSKGFPASKIVLGMPFYAYSYADVQNGEDGLYQTYSSGKSVAYDKLVSTYLSDPTYIRYYDADAHASWLFNGTTMITFDDAQSIQDKTDYIKANGLAGAMIWELSQNRNGELISGIYTALR